MLLSALDIGGSSVKYAVVDTAVSPPGVVRRFDPIPLTERTFGRVEEAVVQAVRTTIASEPSIGVVAISTTGSVDRSGLVLNAGHFSGYSNVNWQERLVRLLGRELRVMTLNDGRASTWAEYLPYASSCRHFVHLTVGTGVGGGTVVDGRLVVGDAYSAGHLGHLRLTDAETVKCSCGKRGCLEALAAVPAIIARYDASAEGRVSEERTFHDVLSAAADGDDAALSAIAEAGRWLGTGISLLLNVLNPRIVTVGGGVLVATESLGPDGGPYLTAAVRAAREHAHKRVVEGTLITQARFGNDGGLIGAAALTAACFAKGPTTG